MTSYGGYGGYSVGALQTDKSSKLYINVGGQGKSSDVNNKPCPVEDYPDKTKRFKCISSLYGGYNGGAGVAGAGFYYAGSGGATHIATRSGVLSSLESYKGALVNNSYYNSSTILIVAGGGGVFCPYLVNNSDPTSNYYAKDCRTLNGGYNGGGFKGGGSSDGSNVLGGTQVAGGVSQYVSPSSSEVVKQEARNGMFGQGNGGYLVTTDSSSGGGGGFYGGAQIQNTYRTCGGGGSGYIASSKLISGGGITKHMTGYSVPTSSVAATRTYSNTTTPTSTPTADVARTGNGYAKITYIAPTI